MRLQAYVFCDCYEQGRLKPHGADTPNYRQWPDKAAANAKDWIES